MKSLENINAKGNRKEVIPHPVLPDEMVRAYFHKSAESVEQARGTYILQKLTNILIPGLMPEVKDFGIEDVNGYEVPYMDVDRVPLDEFHLNHHSSKIQHEAPTQHINDYYRNEHEDSREFRREIFQILEEYGLFLKARKDNHPGNWSLADKDIKYLDMQPPWRANKKGLFATFDYRKIVEHVDKLEDKYLREEAEHLLAELISITPKELLS